MKKFLSIIALVFASSVALAQGNEKSAEATKTKSSALVGQGASLVGSVMPGGSVISNRISMNVTVAKQTQGATFGEKVNAGLHAAGSVMPQGITPLSSSNAKTASPVGPIKGVIVKGSKN